MTLFVIIERYMCIIVFGLPGRRPRTQSLLHAVSPPLAGHFLIPPPAPNPHPPPPPTHPNTSRLPGKTRSSDALEQHRIAPSLRLRKIQNLRSLKTTCTLISLQEKVTLSQTY